MINPWSMAQSIITSIETNMWIILHKLSFVNVSPKNLKGLTSHATRTGLVNDFFPTLAPPNSFIRNQNSYKHQANLDIYPSLIEIMALLYTWNEHNGYLCCPDHAHFRSPLSHFVIQATTKFVLLILYNIITFLWAVVPSCYFDGHAQGPGDFYYIFGYSLKLTH